MTSRWATVSQVRAMAKDWPTTYIKCRIDGHGPWQPHRVTASHTPWGKFIRAIEKCDSCGTRRVTEYLQKQYTVKQTARWVDEYPVGFLSDKGRLAGDARDALKLIYLERRTGGLASVTTSDVDDRDYRPRSQRTRIAMGWKD